MISGETAQYIIERFGDNRQQMLNDVMRKLTLFYDNSKTYLIYTPSRGDILPLDINLINMMYILFTNLILLFTLLINLNICYISLLLSKMDDLSEYFKQQPILEDQPPTLAVQVEFKQKLEKLEELYKKLKKTYNELPNNLVTKMNELLDKYFTSIHGKDNQNIYTYHYFELLLETMTDTLKGHNMEANYGVLLHTLINDRDRTALSIKDYTINILHIPRQRPQTKQSETYNGMCKTILDKIKIIATSIYATAFTNINNILTTDSIEQSVVLETARLSDIEIIKTEFTKASERLDDNTFITTLNSIILKINDDIKSKLVTNKTTIIINTSVKIDECISYYYNNYVEPDEPLPAPIIKSPMEIPLDMVTIPPEQVSIDILSVIKLKKDANKMDDIIDGMNVFILGFNADASIRMDSKYDVILKFVNILGQKIIDMEIVTDDWTIQLPEIGNFCKDISTLKSNFVEKSVMCTISKINLIDAFNDIEYINKRNEFDLPRINTETKGQIIAFGIINQLLKITGNKAINIDLSGGGQFLNSDYILNSEYVLSLSLAKNFFKEFYWKKRLITALKFLDSTMRFYQNTDFVKTIHLIYITRKYCQYVFDTHDLISYNPVNTFMTKTINPAIHRILCLYISQIYLPSFNTVKKLALSIFPSEILKMHSLSTDVGIPEKLKLISRKKCRYSSRRILTKSTKSKKSIQFKKSTKSKKSKQFKKSKKAKQFKKSMKAKRFIKSKINVSLLSNSFSPVSLGIINSTNSIQESIETRLAISQMPDEYNIEKLYIDFTTELWSCGELATVYIDEQFCNIPKYIETFQSAYDNEIKNQVIIPSDKPLYYTLIKYNPMSNKQSFIMNKSIDFENIYNLIHLFKQFKHNPLYVNEGALPENLWMFNLGDKIMLERIGGIIGRDITIKETLLKIAAFINKTQQIVKNHYRQILHKFISTKSTKPTKSTKFNNPTYSADILSREIIAHGGAGVNKNTNYFTLINHQLKLYIISVSTDPLLNPMDNTELIHQTINTYLSPIELDNTIELKGCLLLLSNLFDGLIFDNIIPPYTIEIMEIYDFTIG